MSLGGIQFTMDRLKDTDRVIGTAGQVLTSNGNAGVKWETPSGGGGGSIGGSITNTQVAFGDTTAGDIKGSANVTFTDDATSTGISTLNVGGGYAQSIINCEQLNSGTARARVQVSKNGVTRGWIECSGSSTDFNVTSENRLLIASNGSQPIIMAPDTGVGIGLTNIDTDAGLHVKERIVGDKGIQVGVENSTAAVESLEGTLRYNYVEGAVGAFSYSHIEMCMQTDNSTWSWVNIETNRWTQN